MYEEVHSLITDLAGWFLQDNTKVYDIGTSTGKVLRNLTDVYNKNIEYIGIDDSKEMIDKLNSENVEFTVLKADVADGYYFENSSLIISVLTLQFIEESKRQLIINNVYKGLNKGSAFILVEKVIGNNAKFNSMWTDLYHEMKLKNGLSAEHIFQKSKAIRGVMRPLTIKENITMLEQAGFRDIDTFFKWNNFVGFIAIK